MRLSWGGAVTAVVTALTAGFGAGMWVRGSEWPVRGIYRIGYGVGRMTVARQEAACRGLGVPPEQGWPVGGEGGSGLSAVR